MRAGTAALLATALIGAGCGGRPAAAEVVIAGRAAQALRCAAYVGMAGQSAFDAGAISAEDRAVMASWSFLVLERWLPLDPDTRLAAYRTALAELGPGWRSPQVIERHADWCVETFTPL